MRRKSTGSSLTASSLFTKGLIYRAETGISNSSGVKLNKDVVDRNGSWSGEVSE